MEARLLYQIRFLSYWHVGSGLSGSTYADATVLRDRQDFPIIPGKTLKGLLHHAAKQISQLQADLIDDAFIRDVFGESGEDKKGDYKTSEYHFTSASLSENLKAQLGAGNLTKSLYEVLSATKIENGLAEEGTLRQLEVCVPLTLYAAIEGKGIIDHAPKLDYCFQYIKRMGLNRNRGLGSCIINRITEAK